INAPDTPCLINSLQVLQKSKNLNFKIKTHRVLIIKRRDQEIIDLKRMDDLDSKESFIILHLEETTQEQLKDFTAAIQKILSAVIHIQKDKKAIIAQLHNLEQIPAFKPWESFLSWIQQEAFVPFTYCSFIVNSSGKQLDIQVLGEKHLGLSFDFLFESAPMKADLSPLLTILHPDEIQREAPLLVQKIGIKST